jgi:hypothetical protein
MHFFFLRVAPHRQDIWDAVSTCRFVPRLVMNRMLEVLAVSLADPGSGPSGVCRLNQRAYTLFFVLFKVCYGIQSRIEFRLLEAEI